MEKITGSLFAKFEENQIENLSAIKGGLVEINTGCGAAMENNGSGPFSYFTFTSDSLNETTGAITYCGKVYEQY